MSDPQTSTLSTSICTNCSDNGHDVFINHRGPDVKNTFASHLYYRLRSHGLQPFLDREELQAGELLSPQIEAAIRTAFIHIIIFSPGYANSRWCLDELVLILNKSGDTIIPVFYHVKPSELRWTGRYVEALSNHEQKGRHDRYTLEKWRKALSYVSYIIGFELEAYNGDEGKLLDKVVRCVLKKGKNMGMNVARHPTGLEEKIEDFEITVSLQHRHNGKVKVLGSVDMGGLGKRTRPKKVFNGESSKSVHGRVEKGTPISKDPEKVIFQRETLLAATENFDDDKGPEGNITGSLREALLDAPENFHDDKECDAVIFEGGEGNIKSSTLVPRGFRLHRWIRRLVQRCNVNPLGGTGMIEKADPVIFSLKALKYATQNFHEANKIGQGGFGAVYKGRTADGREIAAKILSTTSSQGKSEFLNEVRLLNKIFHVDLVKLLGCCAEGSKHVLVYEYLPNGSLDRILFDPNKHQKLCWEIRYNMILRIARGLLYLHQDCRPRIIHRDIKASNILLDKELNPKIADFGLAKVLHEDESHVSTRVAGTIGYMAPEYALQGKLSYKADVYSFGILLLELIAGRRNTDSNLFPEMQHLLEWAWRLYREGNIEQMIDPSIIETCDKQQASRCIHIALLCTQAYPSLRPPMSTTTSMLLCRSVELPDPTGPVGFAMSSPLTQNTESVLDSDIFSGSFFHG